MLTGAMGQTSFPIKQLLVSLQRFVIASSSEWVSFADAATALEDFSLASSPLARAKAVNMALTTQWH